MSVIVQRVVYAVAALAVAASLGVVLVIHPPQRGCQAAPTSSGVHGTIGLVRFNDTTQNTSLVIQTDSHAKDSGNFTYVAADASYYEAGPATRVQALAFGGDPLQCAGLEAYQFDGNAQRSVPQPGGIVGKATQVHVRLTAILDLVHLGATITFSDLTDKLSFVTTVKPPPDMHAAVTTYEQAMVAQNWTQLYSLTAPSVTAGYTSAQFAAALQQQEKQVGTITAVTVVSGPVIGTNPAGITYFTVTEQWTVNHNGQVQTSTYISTYILENGTWMFWYSQPQ